MSLGGKIDNIIVSQQEYYRFNVRIDANVKKNTLLQLDLCDIGGGRYILTTMETKNCVILYTLPIRCERDDEGLYITFPVTARNKKKIYMEIADIYTESHRLYIA